MLFHYQAVSPNHRNESAYKLTCQYCGAPPGFRCAGRRTGQPQRDPHRKRRAVDHERLPNLSSWWKSAARWEGKHAKRRPPDYVVPSNADILKSGGAA